MTERFPNPDLEQAIKDKFAGLTDADIIRRMNAAPDFGYDDEAVELNRRLGSVGLSWRWSRQNRVLIFDPAEEVQPNSDEPL
ncbi:MULTISPECIES: hypothetical protein [Arthrobacter]|uniref:Uncharacterized protein n=1 Tax=Arthrobacter terricola TaxID=2547396 RepID=A0A4R5KL97_9MICC|nr:MULTISPECIES: hypothetical protein [Arthrobacter]MBT8161447.1 hypothetical protein [Arthrobacter sp. GN70]TDF95618.1 hypothetical protein E1809_11365 [Arthrobacter terricola]